MIADPAWLAFARQHLGTRENPGPTNNNRLIALLNTASRWNGVVWKDAETGNASFRFLRVPGTLSCQRWIRSALTSGIRKIAVISDLSSEERDFGYWTMEYWELGEPAGDGAWHL